MKTNLLLVLGWFFSSNLVAWVPRPGSSLLDTKLPFSNQDAVAHCELRMLSSGGLVDKRFALVERTPFYCLGIAISPAQLPAWLHDGKTEDEYYFIEIGVSNPPEAVFQLLVARPKGFPQKWRSVFGLSSNQPLAAGVCIDLKAYTSKQNHWQSIQLSHSGEAAMKLIPSMKRIDDFELNFLQSDWNIQFSSGFVTYNRNLLGSAKIPVLRAMTAKSQRTIRDFTESLFPAATN